MGFFSADGEVYNLVHESIEHKKSQADARHSRIPKPQLQS